MGSERPGSDAPRALAQARAPAPLRVGHWITPGGTGPQAQAARRRGHHRLQIAIDTVAYAHNIPLRLLLPSRLKELPGVIAQLLRDPDILAVLRDDAAEMQVADYASLASERHLRLACDWILNLPSTQAGAPAALPPHWLQGALALLPFIERKVWLTEMGNPLPVHALCRMQDHWSLYVLMWTWRHADRLGRPESVVPDVLHTQGLEVRTLRPFRLQGAHGHEQPCLPVVGPYFVADDLMSDVARQHAGFCDHFARFVENVVEIDRDREGRSHTVPLREELLDALGSRMNLVPAEARLRAATCAHTLDLMRNTIVADVAFSDAMSRADWEVIAALSAWLARWDDALLPCMLPGQEVLLSHDGDRAALLVSLDPAGDPRAPLRLAIVDRDRAGPQAVPMAQLLKQVDDLKRAALGPERDAFRVDRPERYFGRIRERQNSMWSSQVIAINNLLSRHGPRDVYIGSDEFVPEGADGRSPVQPEEAEHLLRGFGGRICRYLVSMTRADAAAIYWLDYAQAPPRLLPAGDYGRHPAHRTQGHAIWERFDRWAWAPGPELTNTCQANRRGASLSQAYRVAATGVEDPPPALPPSGATDEASEPTDTAGQRKRVRAEDGPPPSDHDDTVPAHFMSYPEPCPADAMAAPLLVNGRVIGVVTLLGLVSGQFEPRLFWPLRRAASLAAACMYHQSQVWHMRRLNYLFVRRGLHEFQRRGAGSHQPHSPLRDVSRCLANIFLCPAAHIWLNSTTNDDRLELLGYNWDGMFRFDDAPSNFAREFEYSAPKAEPGPPFRPFSCMAIDLARAQGAGDDALGKFVQGTYDPHAATTTGYDSATASRRGARLGRDFEGSAAAPDDAQALRSRGRIFGGEGEGGYRLLDIMSFALVSPPASALASSAQNGWKTVGVVTLHDKGDAYREPLRLSQPWDRGWASVVAHMQTYLPYLFKQAEVLNNPEVDARRYLIHAGRAELIAVMDNMARLRQRLESALAPGRGVRQMLDKVMAPDFAGDHRIELRAALLTVSDAWETLGLAASPNWEHNLRQLANVMHEYRGLSALPGVEITAPSERVFLRQLLEQTILRFAHEFKHRRSRHIDVPESLELRLPGQWLRIVLQDLVHNAAKYASGDSFSVTWDHAQRCLSLVNEGPYQSDLDRPESLLAAGGQGSAGRLGRATTQAGSRGGDARGHGLGLWGAKLLCGVMDTAFSIEARPMRATVRVRADGVQLGAARYIVKLVFPASAVVSTTRAAASRDFY